MGDEIQINYYSINYHGLMILSDGTKLGGLSLKNRDSKTTITAKGNANAAFSDAIKLGSMGCSSSINESNNIKELGNAFASTDESYANLINVYLESGLSGSATQ